jgi:hypothetical protein
MVLFTILKVAGRKSVTQAGAEEMEWRGSLGILDQ